MCLEGWVGPAPKPHQETPQGLETPSSIRVPTPDHPGSRNPSMSEWDDGMGVRAVLQFLQLLQPRSPPGTSRVTFQLKRWPQVVAFTPRVTSTATSHRLAHPARSAHRKPRLADQSPQLSPRALAPLTNPPPPQAPSLLATTAPSGSGLPDGFRPTWAMATARWRTEVSHAPMSSNQA